MLFGFVVTVMPAAAGALLLAWETNWKIGASSFLFFLAIWLTVYFRDDQS